MIRILHLFPKLLSLYGEYGNIEALKESIEENGCEVEITAAEDNFDFSILPLKYV